MINNIFKSLFLIVAVVATYCLFLIAQGLSYNRYTFTGENIFDGKTKKIYYFSGGQIIKVNEKGVITHLKELPN